MCNPTPLFLEVLLFWCLRANKCGKSWVISRRGCGEVGGAVSERLGNRLLSGSLGATGRLARTSAGARGRPRRAVRAQGTLSSLGCSQRYQHLRFHAGAVVLRPEELLLLRTAQRNGAAVPLQTAGLLGPAAGAVP